MATAPKGSTVEIENLRSSMCIKCYYPEGVFVEARLGTGKEINVLFTLDEIKAWEFDCRSGGVCVSHWVRHCGRDGD